MSASKYNSWLTSLIVALLIALATVAVMLRQQFKQVEDLSMERSASLDLVHALRENKNGLFTSLKNHLENRAPGADGASGNTVADVAMIRLPDIPATWKSISPDQWDALEFYWNAWHATVGFLVELTWLARDISDVRQRIDIAENLNKAKSRFISNVSHDMRTPLNAMIGCGFLMRSAPLTAEHKEHLDTMLQASEFLLGMINDLLDVAKIESGEFRLANEHFELSRTLATVTDIMQVNALDKGLQFDLEPIPSTVHGSYAGDPLRLRQMLFNLLGNAIKFTQHGRIGLRVSNLGVESGRERLRFEVSDTGIGISEADQARLFQRFSQIDNSDQRRFGGTGLGLSIVRDLAEQMGGGVSVSSKPSVGSTFSFDVVLECAQHSNENINEVAQEDVFENAFADLIALVVDDSALNRRVATRVLEKQGATVVTAEDGQIAIDWLMHPGNRADIVLMDLQMPVMDGLEATRRIRAERRLRQLPVIAMSAGAESSSIDAAKQAGTDAFIAKPFDPMTLFRTISALIAAGNADTPDQQVQRNTPERAADAKTVAAVIDLERALTTFRHDMDRLNEYFRIFERNFASVARAMQYADTSLGRRAVVTALRSLNSSARVMAADHLAESMAELLECLEHGNLADTSRHWSEVVSHVEQLRHQIEQNDPTPSNTVH